MPDSLIITVTSVRQTQEFARALGAAVKSDDFIILTGELGAGKTYFTQGLAEGLGVAAAVTSPTYTIINIYQGRIPLYHFDFYRLNQSEELEAVGYEDYFFDSGGVVIAEWGDKFPALLPNGYLTIDFHRLIDNEEARKLEVSSRGRRAEELIEKIKTISQQLSLKIELS